MSIRRSQASVLSGINSATTNKIDVVYNKVSAGYIPTATSAVTAYTTSQTWTRPSNVHWIDIALVGGGGSSSQTVTGSDGGGGSTSRRGGGGGGGAVIQVNRFYVGDYNTWYIIIGGNSSVSSYANNDCNGNSWGRSGNPTIFSPISSSYAITSLTGVDNSNLRRTLIAPGGGGGGHPCGSSGPISLTSSGGEGSNGNASTYRSIPDENSGSGKVPWQGYGGRGGITGGTTSPGGGGGGSGGNASTSTGGTGRTLVSPFSTCYGGGGAGGGGTSGGCGGGTPGVAGTNGTGGGGGAGSAARTVGLTGGTGRIEIRQWFS